MNENNQNLNNNVTNNIGLNTNQNMNNINNTAFNNAQVNSNQNMNNVNNMAFNNAHVNSNQNINTTNNTTINNGYNQYQNMNNQSAQPIVNSPLMQNNFNNENINFGQVPNPNDLNGQKKNNSKLIIIIISAVVALILMVSIGIGISSLSKNKKEVMENYVALDYPTDVDLLYDAHLKQTIRTFYYDENRNVTRVIFSDIYNDESYATEDYNRHVKTDGQFGRKLVFINVDGNVLTYEYTKETLEENYPHFYPETVDSIILEYGEALIVEDFIPNLSKSNNDNKTTKKENNKITSKEVDNDVIAQEVEDKLAANYNKFYKQLYNKEISYIATVDKESIHYTDEFSAKDKYYVMEVTVSNPSTGINVKKFYARCKWDSKNGTIKDYADNTRVVLGLGLYEDAIVGMFIIDEKQYKNEELWDNSDITKDNVFDIISIPEEVIYLFFDTSSSVNKNIFEQRKNEQLEKIKKVVKCKNLKVHFATIVSEDELAAALDATKYFTIDIYLGKEEKMNEVLNYLKQQTLYHEEVLHLLEE